MTNTYDAGATRPDRLDAVVALAARYGATQDTHNMGGVHADLFHACTRLEHGFTLTRITPDGVRGILAHHAYDGR